MFHSLDPKGPQVKEEDGLIITPKNFERDLRYLKQQGFTFIDYKQMMSMFIKAPNTFNYYSDRNVLVTFDDGYRDNYIYAYPILKAEDIKAIIDVVVYYIEKRDPAIPDHYLSWSQINEMKKSGIIQIGSHSYNSHHYIKLKSGMGPMLAGRKEKNGVVESYQDFENRIRIDLVKSQEFITKRTSETPEVIAFPFGWAAPETKKAAGELGFKVQMGVKSGVNYHSADLRNLKRIAVKNSYSPEQLTEKMNYYIGANLLLP
jgi:biofilm PGA synthesis lipoprotein PgaB